MYSRGKVGLRGKYLKGFLNGMVCPVFGTNAEFRIQDAGGSKMKNTSANSHTPPDGFVKNQPADEMVNDSLGTVDLADNTGTDSEEEAAKAGKGADRDPAAHDKSEVVVEKP
jgi:hypothetical protein